jgi:hypothetical protein
MTYMDQNILAAGQSEVFREDLLQTGDLEGGCS